MKYFACLVLSILSLAAAPEDAAKEETQKIQGRWRVLTLHFDGIDQTLETGIGNKDAFVFADDDLTMVESTRNREMKFKLDPSSDPKSIDLWSPKDKGVAKGIYAIDGNTLRITFTMPDQPRPKQFDTTAGLKTIAVTFHRPRATDEEDRKALEALAPKAEAMLKAASDRQQAIEKYEQLIELALRVYGPDHPETGRFQHHIGDLYRGTGQHAKAVPMLEGSVRVARRAFGPDSPQVDTSANNLAISCQHVGLFERAETLFLDSLRIAEKESGSRSRRAGISLVNLGELYTRSARFADAQRVLQRSLKIFEGKFGPDDYLTGITVNALAFMHKSSGNFEEAERLYRRALGIMERVSVPDAPTERIKVRNNLATLYLEMGQHEKARLMLEDLLAGLEKTPDASKYVVGLARSNLGIALLKLGKVEDAIRQFDRAVALMEELLGKDSPMLGRLLNNQAVVLVQKAQFDQALLKQQRVLGIFEKSLGKDHPDVAAILLEIGAIGMVVEDWVAAEACYDRAIEIMEKTPGGVKMPTYHRFLIERAFLAAARKDPAAKTWMQRGLAAEQDKPSKSSRSRPNQPCATSWRR